jgi:uncharacterized membrane protein YdbT with pleckstrin-like domain
MSSYIESVLTSNEKILYQAKMSMWAQAPAVLLGIVLTPVFGLGLLILLGVYITKISTELAITDKRVIAKFGFIRRNTVEINLHKIESIQVAQGLLGRIFDFGSLVVSGAGNPQAPIPGICRPIEFRKAFTEAQERHLAARAA